MVTANPLSPDPISTWLSARVHPNHLSGNYNRDNDTPDIITDEPLQCLDYYSQPLLSNTGELSTVPENNNFNTKYQRKRWRDSQLMQRLAKLIVLITVSILLISIPILTYELVHSDILREDTAAFLFTGFLVVLTVIISTREIYMHLTNWYMPDVQKYVVRILYMVPLYGLQSWLALVFHSARLYIDTLRDFYEAFVIYSFVSYLIELLGGEDALAETLRFKDAHYGEHSCGMQYFFRRWEMGEEFMLECKWGTLQYVIIKTLATIAIIILQPLGLYCEGSFSVECSYLYLSIILNLSVSWALYCLVVFYHATAEDLRHPVNWRPLGKFLCIKGVVFFTFWQSVLIDILRSQGVIKGIGSWDADKVASSMQNVLICIEMLVFAIAHCFTFTYKECLPQGRSRGGDLKDDTLLDSMDDDTVYSEPSTIRTLNRPMKVSDAFWSSTMPNDTLSDIKRLGKGTSKVIMSKELKTPVITLTAQHAESI